MVSHSLLTNLVSKLRDRKVKDRLDLIDSFGEDNYPNGTVLKFTKKEDSRRYGPDRVYKYLYAAIKVKDAWYLAGSQTSGTKYTWDELTAFAASGDHPVKKLRNLTEKAQDAAVESEEATPQVQVQSANATF